MPKSPLAKPASRRHGTRSKQAGVTLGLTGSAAAGITHQYNNLLMVIRTCAELIHADTPPSDARHGCVERLIAAADQASDLTNLLQAFALPSMRHPQQLQPGRILHTMADTLRRMVPEDIEVRFSIRSTGFVQCDPVQLQSLVLVLISRAIEEVKEAGRISIAMSDDDGADARSMQSFLLLSLTSRASSTSRSRRKSSDLLKQPATRLSSDHSLLVLAADIARENEARLEASYEPSRGTVVRVFLPRVYPGERHRPASPTTQAAEALHGSEVVLLVEDDGAVRWSVREILERFGYTVFDAGNGAEALRILDMLSAPPDLLITDIVMPEVNGVDLLQTLQEERRINKVLLISGYADDQVLRRAGPMGHMPLLRKPFTPHRLGARVRDVLDS